VNDQARGSHPAHTGMRSTLIGILINLLLAAGKATAGVLGNSYALVADAIESMSDVVSSFIVWLGLRLSAKPPDENHPYGHGKAEPMAAGAVAVALLAAAIGIAVQSVREIMTPHHAPAPFTLAVLVGVILVKEGLFRFVFRVGEDVGSTAVKGDAWHHRSDAITSAAAFIGISIALLGGEGWESADDWAALFASGIIAYNASRIFRVALLELSDVAPDRTLLEQVRNVALEVEGVLGLHQCRIRKVGFDHYVELDVIVDGEMTVNHAHAIAHLVQDTVRSSIPCITRVLVHIEPHHPDRVGVELKEERG
jgi:cation diffusion facilitator family transporter